MSLPALLLAVLGFLFLVALPAWPYSYRWGFGPSGALCAVLLIVIVLMLAGQIPSVTI